jgi:hypothetical protein
MGRGDPAVPGFHSIVRGWAGESTAYAREVVEGALAHRLQDRAGAAYARGDLFGKRRKPMDDGAVSAHAEPAPVLPQTVSWPGSDGGVESVPAVGTVSQASSAYSASRCSRRTSSVRATIAS